MKQSTRDSLEPFLKGLKTLLKSLPSEEERIELIQTLTETQDFLEELKNLIDAFPTLESTRDMSQSLTRLDILVDRAVNHSALRKVMGLKGSRVLGIKNVNGTDDIEARAKELNDTIKSTNSEALIGMLERSGEPTIVLVTLANLLGIRTRKKERKAELINRIGTHITNQRGSRLLRGVDPNTGELESVRTPVV